VPQPKDLDLNLHLEDGSSMDLWNVGILPQHYAASQPRRPWLESSPWRGRQHWPPKRWYPTTTLHGVTTQNSTWIILKVEAAWNSKTVVPQHKITQTHNPEELEYSPPWTLYDLCSLKADVRNQSVSAGYFQGTTLYR
jgi:hypothetical protein